MCPLMVATLNAREPRRSKGRETLLEEEELPELRPDDGGVLGGAVEPLAQRQQ